MADVRIDTDQNVRIDTGQSGVAQVYVSGEIDLTNAAEITATVTRHAPADGEIVLDLTDVTYFDTTGVKMLLDLKETFGDRLTILPGIRVLKILDIIGLRDKFRLRIEDHTDADSVIRDGENIHLPRHDEGRVK